MLVHSVHVALVVAGLAGLGALLGPTLARRPRAGTRPAPARDAHDARVWALRAAVARYAVDGSIVGLRAGSEPARDRLRLEPAGSKVLVPLAVTGSLAAASVHAVQVPAHLTERSGFAVFFLAVATVQLAWAARGLRRPTRPWLGAGAVGTLAVLALWATTRTVGLPAVLPEAEAVGAWDLTCAAFEVAVVGACVTGLLRGVRPPAPWRDWHPAAHATAALATTLVVVLSLGGVAGTGGHG